jgi:hypothetical protein
MIDQQAPEDILRGSLCSSLREKSINRLSFPNELERIGDNTATDSKTRHKRVSGAGGEEI